MTDSRNPKPESELGEGCSKLGEEQGQKPVAGKSLGCSRRREGYGGVRGREFGLGGGRGLGEKGPSSLEQGRALSSRWVERRWSLRPLSLPCHYHAVEPARAHAWSSAAWGRGWKEELEPIWSLLSSLAVSVPNQRLRLNMGHMGASACALGARWWWANPQQTWDGSLAVTPPNVRRTLLLSFIHSLIHLRRKSVSAHPPSPAVQAIHCHHVVAVRPLANGAASSCLSLPTY